VLTYQEWETERELSYKNGNTKPFYSLRLLSLVVTFALALTLRPLTAAASSPSWCAAGTEFYATFLPVVGSSDTNTQYSERSLFISSRAPTKVTIETFNNTYKRTVVVSPGTVTRIDLPINAGLGRNDYEVARSNVVHIYSNETITVYGLAHNYLSSDGFLIYPVQSLGTVYMVMSLPNAVNYDPTDFSVNPRSEFAVVATQDNTNVSIRLTATSYSGSLLPNITYNITLKRGQTYMVMARDTGVQMPANSGHYVASVNAPSCDLTGTSIISDKPIAVFSGHERAATPSSLEFTFQDPSRDHLAEQLIPVSQWGTRFVVVASGQDANNKRAAGGNLIRVLSSADGAHIRVNGTVVATLPKGGYYDFMSGAASFIQSDVPVLVADFMQSCNLPADKQGDPDMTLVRPIDLFSNYYTLPGWDNEIDPFNGTPVFAEPHILVVCDASAITTTLLSGAALTGPWTPIAGTNYVYGIFNCGTEEQRIESPLPCYAESFAFGYQDSYTFAGGGDYAYVDSLYAADLDFKAISVASTKNLSSTLKTSIAPMEKDTVLVYGYEWVSGDTLNFDLPQSPFQPQAIVPGATLTVPITFHPNETRPYAATFRVWSNAVNPVFVHVRGSGLLPRIKVFPLTIDFGRVRLGIKRDSAFVIQDTGNSPLTLQDLVYQNSIVSDQFTAQNLGSKNAQLVLQPGTAVVDSVHYLPTKLGQFVEHIPIFSDDPVQGLSNPPTVTLIGTGVNPIVVSSGHDFGSLRVLNASSIDTVAIVNRGTDSTAIDSVTIDQSLSTGLADFTVVLDSFPPANKKNFPVSLEYQGPDTIRTFTIQFHPLSLGKKQLAVRIHTTDGEVLHDVFTGVGVEPLVLVQPKVIDFDTIVVNTTIPLVPSQSFTVTNAGTMIGELDSLVCSDTAHFHVVLNKPTRILQESIDTAVTLTGTATFNAFEEGDFIDTVFVRNDTRYRFYPQRLGDTLPMVILRASVRTGPINQDSVDFGTITTCDPHTSLISIHNPYPVTIQIDTAIFLSDTGGFSIPKTFLFPIVIAGDSTYNLPIRYAFPPDSLNGPQRVIIGLYQHRGKSEAPIIDTMFATVIRKQRVFKLYAHLPSYASSANDISALRLPITVEGPRAGVTELNSWTLSLQFSNDLFEPIGVDTTGALAVKGDSTFTFTTHWDQATRTFTIIVTGSSVADSSKVANNLLLSLLMRAYLTTDTEVTVTPTFTWAQHPCAYNLQSFKLSIPYADECGDPTIRAMMRHEAITFRVSDVWPNPVNATEQTVSIGYQAADPVYATVRVYREDGEETGEWSSNLEKGANSFALSQHLLPKTGPAFVRIETATSSGLRQVQTVKIDQIH